MISCDPLEKNRDGNICKISRKRGRSLTRLKLKFKEKKNNLLYNDIHNCIIEVTPNNDRVEENVIEIKNEDHNNYFFDEMSPSKEGDLHITLINQTTDEKLPTTPTISISECGYMGASKKEDEQIISAHLSTEVETGSNSSFQEEVFTNKNCIKGPKYDIELNCKTLTEEEKRHLKAEVDPKYLDWVEKLKIPEKCQFPQHFMVDDFEEVKEILTKYEHETFTRLLVSDVNGGFRIENIQYSGETVHFRVKGKQELLFHGSPFAICGKLTFRCHQGIFAKRIDKEIKRDKQFGPNRKRYRKFKSSKKKNCPLRITVIRALVFPEYRVDVSKYSPAKLYEVSRFIKRNKEKMKFLVKYVFTLPSVFDHRNHQLGDESVSREAVDKRVFDKVEDYVRAGITKAPEVKELLKSFIQHELEIDHSQWQRRKYNPSLKDIRAKIYRTLRDMKAKVDQSTITHNCGRRETALKNSSIKTLSSSQLTEMKHESSHSSAIEQHFTTPVTYTEGHVKKENDMDLQSHFSVDLSEGNVHHEELIAIASIIDVHSDDNGGFPERYHDDDNKQKLVGEDISKLNLLSMILRGPDLAELKNDVSTVVNKWKSVLNVCETNAINGHKDMMQNTKKLRREKPSPPILEKNP